MPRLRVLSGRVVIATLGEFGFQRAMQRGSHVRLRRDQ
jgi:predicted RNA binding protein YcfA (HicA-like mRNA interferase family)